MSGPKPRPVEERLLAKVHKTDYCWLWTGGKWGSGYGSLLGGERRVEGAHVVSYKLYVGHVPKGMKVDHRCHVKTCVNPTHLRLVTTKQNAENREGAVRGSKSGIRGVTWDGTQRKWRVSVHHNGQVTHFGRFTDVKEAERVAIAKRNELFTHNDKDREIGLSS